MYQCFQEIAYEADMDTRECPELLEYAAELCNENLTTRQAAISDLREMIYDRNQCCPHRTDDAFLLRFLRARNFIVPRAHALLVRYCNFRIQYPYLYEGVDLWGMSKLKAAYEGTTEDHPDYGRITVIRFAAWDPNEFPVVELTRMGLLLAEAAIRNPKIQVLGGTVIVDLAGTTLKHVATLTPTVAHQVVNIVGLSMPTRMRSCHIINYSWILSTFFYLFKQFIPADAFDRIYFHGSDVKSLQKHFRKEYLPERYGGTCRSLIGAGIWLEKIKKYRDDKFDKEMKELGYIVKE